MVSALSILHRFWGYQQFRPLQDEIVASVAGGRDTLALLPTGGGKSICFQVPAMMNDGLCLVVTPLIALMKDQVENLNKRGIPAFAIYAGMQARDVEKVLALAREGEIKFLYVSPERLQSRRFLWYCEVLPVKLIAVDEAHCISQWGYDFRPAYLQVASIREQFPDAPVLALTATATPKVKEDICAKLNLRNPAVFVKSFARANLSYSVSEGENKLTRIQQILDRVPGAAIVYCRNRRQTKEVAGHLSARGITASYYHAGLSGAERSARQEAWIKNDIRVMVCTNAFGMGIDKPDVRLVIHDAPPESIEAYYQEAGRAGRDEQKAYAVMLYSERDISEMEARIPLQFPSLDEIREVFQAVVNFLQVPKGTEGVYYDFDINEFVKRFSLNITTALSVLRILEQEGVWQLSESVYLPSKVEFVTGRERMDEYETANPSMEPLIKTLLRTYEGILENPVPIFEKQVARLMRIDEQDVIHDLQLLHRQAIIRYYPRKDNPQLNFLEERVSAQFLQVNMARVEARKKVMERRIAAIAAYARNSNTCRTQQLVAYFGEQNAQPCGVCDVCVKKSKREIKPGEFGELAAVIVEALREKGTVQALVDRVDAEESRVLATLQFLIAEGIVLRDADGMLSAVKG
ncbi:ATP-dependent DNA helicase RecQ [Chitinophaga sp. GCM10012297]|uniref:ATP-dependent DNA helicase RecQ n=1 Tax=Chitinophaga chungangae TaxID=2821488 RepID=A0ABS3YCM2_9BACT|nr:ATP-dependent DNA helicase RecQ [Chitinophaga chungangae]MBO9152427.1 RecQ family ATP-dependent DNA helicase [Chitinophaga chungangae]